MTTENTNQKPAILVQTPGAGPKCKIRRNGAQMLKAAWREQNTIAIHNSSLRDFARTLADHGDKDTAIAAKNWLRHKRIKPDRKANPKRMKKSSDHISKGQGRCGKARLPMRQVQFSFKVN